MNAYKFLAAGRRHPFTSVHFPAPGTWVHAGDLPADGTDAVRACTAAHLAHWVDDELWDVELAGDTIAGEFSMAARRVRLVAPVAAWDATTGRALAAACAWRARDVVAQRLADAGEQAAADALRAASTLADLVTTATTIAATAPSAWSDPIGYLAEVGDEAEHLRVGTAMLTATVAVAGWDDEGQAAERRWQTAWIVDRLGLATV